MIIIMVLYAYNKHAISLLHGQGERNRTGESLALVRAAIFTI